MDHRWTWSRWKSGRSAWSWSGGGWRQESGLSPLSNGVQRAAARGLCVFLALMAVLTLLSRAADGITVAQVQAQNPKTGILPSG
ncbi:MAG: hypothetical protein ACLSAF_18500 [Intestinimonas sp.]